MAKIRRVIRKVQTPGQLVIDEQFWPVMLALFVLSGFLIGTVAAYLPFGANRWWQDATTWMFVISIVTCIAVWLLRLLPSHFVRRALQISIVLGLLFHVFMLIVSIESRIFGNLWQPTARTQPRRPQRELRIVGDYLTHRLDHRQRQQEDFVKPVETTVPEPVPDTIERRQERPERSQVDPPPMPAPQTPRNIRRNAIERPTPAETKPRQGEQASKLSRQTIETRPHPNELISVPTVATSSAQSSMLDARDEGLRRRSAETQASHLQTASEPSTITAQNAPTIARRATERAPEIATRSAPTLPRQLAQPSSVARVDVRTGETPSSSKQTSSEELQPARTTTRQQLTASPRVSPIADTFATPQSAPVTSPTPQRELPSPKQPQLAQAPGPVANRKPRTTSRPDAASAATTVAMNALPTADNGQNIAATSSTVTATRSLAGGGPGLQRPLNVGSATGPAAGSAAPAPPAPAATPSIATTSARAQTAVGSAGQPVTAAANYLVRTTRRSEVATSTTLADTPRTVTADAGGDQQNARPSRLAMTKSLDGIAGVGQTPNLDRSPSMPGSPSTTASGSARRAHATQNTPPGPALAPSAPALARRSLVGADRPIVSLRATTNSVAEAAGSESPGELNASSGASLARQDANATPSDMTASKGNVDIDLGPTRIADAGGFERASGGGQPDVNLDSESTSLTRTRPGGSAPFALTTTTVDVSAASPLSSKERAESEGELAAGSMDVKQVVTTKAEGLVAVKSDVQPLLTADANAGGQIAATAVSRSEAAPDVPRLQRPEAADAVTGPAFPGGGTAGRQRTTSSRELATNVIADVTSLSGAPASSGSRRGIDTAAQGGEPVPVATGALTRAAKNQAGAVASDAPRDAVPQSGMDVVAGLAPRSTVDGDTPAIGEAAVSGAPLNRSGRTQFNAGPVTASAAGAPSAPMSVVVEAADLKEPAMSTGASTARQQSAAALPIEVAAVDGASGLGDRLALEVGVNSRLATPDSVEVQTTPARFVRQDIGGAPELNTSALFATDAFRNRVPTRSNLPMGEGAGSAGPQTEESIELGLSYLARRQLSDGSWTLRSTTEPVQLASDTAATGLCLLAFQGAGYSHREYKYAARIAGGIDFLVKNQKSDGDLFVQLDDISNRSVWLYSHAIAAIALCEAYGMTHDPQLREPAQKALDFIIATQDPKGGGWRYQPGIESDTSVTGWMMMALKSGELAGLKVPRPTYDQIGQWLDAAQGSANERHLYRYNPHAPDTDSQRHGRATTPTMTAVGLLMRLYGGWRRDHPTMIAGAEHLRHNLPTIGTTREPLRDTYYWYYGTQVMFHMGGELWEEWNGQLHSLLSESQIQQGESAGSWSPRSPVPDRWAPHAGRLYVTTMNLLSLEVTYRHLPLYVDTAK